jgi:uncharacterized protein affecting Mg2+/Co2+ transport
MTNHTGSKGMKIVYVLEEKSTNTGVYVFGFVPNKIENETDITKEILGYHWGYGLDLWERLN